MDMLVESDLHICSQVYMQIEHCLICTIEKIKKFALKIRRSGNAEWLSANPNAEVDRQHRRAVRIAKETEGVAAVASALSAQRYGVDSSTWCSRP